MSYYHSFNSIEGGGSREHQEGVISAPEENPRFNGDTGEDGDAARGAAFDFREAESGNNQEENVLEAASRGESSQEQRAEMSSPSARSEAFDSSEETPLIPMMLYLHRVKGLVLALLAEPHFLSDTASMEEVVRNNSDSHSTLVISL